MRPLLIAALASLNRRGGLTRVAVQPVGHHIVVILLGPQHSRVTLSRYQFLIGRKTPWQYLVIEFICFLLPLRKDGVEIGERSVLGFLRLPDGQSQFKKQGPT